MKKIITKKFLLFALVFCLCSSYQFAQSDNLSKDALLRIKEAVFEVVVKRPDESALKYQKNLNIPGLTYSTRSEQFIPVGTAFVTSDGTFYSAASVFNFIKETVYQDYYLRHNSGAIYKIASVEKLCTERDFVIFTVEDYTLAKGTGLIVETGNVNTARIYSASAKLGGAVTKNGLLLGRSYEEQVGGRWQWYRFSASASADTAGSPLLTSEGKVLGIISFQDAVDAQKLLYALPLEEVLSVPASTGTVSASVAFDIPNVTLPKNMRNFSCTIRLPRPLREVQNVCNAQYVTHLKKCMTTIKQNYGVTGAEGFLYGKGSSDVMSGGSIAVFPMTLMRSTDGRWGFYHPEDIIEEETDAGGVLTYGGMNNLTHALYTKPNDVSFDELLNTPKTYMDALLCAAEITRTFMGETTGFTSFGEPTHSETYTDAFKRTWLVHYWEIAFCDAMAVSYVLPLPQGLYLMLDIDTTGDILGTAPFCLQFYADCVYPRYASTIANWQDFLSTLKRRGMLYAPFTNINISVTDDKTSFISQNFLFSLPDSIFPSSKDTNLRLATGFCLEGSTPSLSLRSLDVYCKPLTSDYRYVYLSKTPKPSAKAQQSTLELWEHQRDAKEPYNAVPYNQGEYTFYDEVLYPSARERRGAQSVSTFALELFGTNREEEIKALATRIKPHITVQ